MKRNLPETVEAIEERHQDQGRETAPSRGEEGHQGVSPVQEGVDEGGTLYRTGRGEGLCALVTVARADSLT